MSGCADPVWFVIGGFVLFALGVVIGMVQE